MFHPCCLSPAFYFMELREKTEALFGETMEELKGKLTLLHYKEAVSTAF